MITHDIAIAGSLPRQVEMRDGEIVGDGALPIARPEAGPRHQTAGLDAPRR